MNVLLVHASTHGHTSKIAHRIVEVMRDAGLVVAERRIDAAPSDLSHYDAIVVGGSLHNGSHQSELADWVRDHRHVIAVRPSAFFSVSLSAAEDSERTRAAVRECIDRFVEDTGWDPDVSAPLAGALQYTRYDLPTRLFMQALMFKGGHPTDTSRDHEMTDWDRVDEFARRAAHHFARAGVAIAA